MLSVKGTYDGKEVRLVEKIQVDHEVEVIVTFLEENLVQEKLPEKSCFHFRECRALLRGLKSSLAEDVVRDREER